MLEPMEAVVAGHLCLDMAPGFMPGTSLADALRPGKLVQMGSMMITTGGAVSNTGLPLRELGINTALMGCVGDDALAGTTRAYLRERGADGYIVTKPGIGSAYTVALVPPGTDRVFLHHPGVNDAFNARDLRWEIVAEARLLHFGYPPLMRGFWDHGGRETIELMARAKALGVTTSMDLALPDPASDAGRADWLGILRGALPHVDVCLPSIEEWMYMCSRAEYEAIRARGEDFLQGITLEGVMREAGRMVDMGVAVAGLKLGALGMVVRTGDMRRLADMGRGGARDVSAWADRAFFCPSFEADFVSSSGAGDSCIAGFLAALLRGLDAQTCAEAACLAGALKVEQMGSVGGTGTLEAMLSQNHRGRSARAVAWGG